MSYYEVSRQGVCESILETAEQIQIDYQFDWMVNWYYKDAGRKDTFYLGMENSPISKIDFELNKRLLGASTIEFASVPIQVDAGDYFDIYYKNNLWYRGYVENYVDLKGGKLKLKPKHERFSNLIINKSYTNYTIEAMLESIIEEVESDSGVSYLAALVSTGESSTYSFDFNFVYVKDALDMLISKLDDREWGITTGNLFTVYTPDSSSNIVLTQCNQPIFSKAERQINYDDIKATRYQVYKKDNAGDTVRVGQVGYDAAGGTYPTLDIETTIGEKREKKYVCDVENISDANALAIAYAALQAQATLPEVINIKNLDINRYYDEYDDTVDIKDYLTVFDAEEKVLTTIIDCDSITSWTNATLEEDIFVEGSGSIKMSGYDPTTSTVYYDFGEIKRYHKPEYILIMFRSVETGSILEWGYSDTLGALWDSPIQIYINESNKWQTYRYDFSDSITMRYLGIRYSDTITLGQQYWNDVGRVAASESFADTPSNKYVYVDRIQLYMYNANVYEGAVKQIKVKIDKFGHDVDVVLNEYNTAANDELIRLTKKYQKIESIQQQ